MTGGSAGRRTRPTRATGRPAGARAPETPPRRHSGPALSLAAVVRPDRRAGRATARRIGPRWTGPGADPLRAGAARSVRDRRRRLTGAAAGRPGVRPAEVPGGVDQADEAE